MLDSATQEVIGNRYVLGQKLGSGGMGTVYRAFDHLTGDTVALKRVTIAPSQLSFNAGQAGANPVPNMRIALAQEFQTMASLRHPHIISVLDYGFDQQQYPYYTMSLLENAQDIRQAASRADDYTKARLVLQMFQAIAYLHRRGIVHRDLKPGNVLVDAAANVKVLDFGLAIQGEQDKQISGTLTYMAPEILRSKGASPLSDLYAAGVIAYEIFAGEHPFGGSNVSNLVRAILSQSPNLDLLPDYLDIPEPSSPNTPTLDMIIGRLLMKAPEDRYPSADAVIQDLSDLMGHTVTETHAIRESYLQAARFVGRDVELADLVGALDALALGKGSRWLIAGESGVGKSRLLEEVRIRALVQGITVLRSHEPAETSIPFMLWRDPVRRLLLSVPVSDLDASILKLVVPDIANLLGRAVGDAPPLHGSDTLQRLSTAITNLFRAHNQPTLLILEDLQWATHSLDPLQQINRSVSGMPLLVLGSYRNDEDVDVAAMLPDMKVLTLARLTESALADLTASMLGAGAKADVIDLLQRETEGNIYFLIETVRALAEDAGGLEDVGAMTLPAHVFAGGVQDVVRRRLSYVPESYLPLLKYAALMGRELDFKVLEQLIQMGSVGEIDLETWLTTCANVPVFANVDERWMFAHDKLRDVLVADFDENQRPGMYAQAAVALENAYPGDPARAGVLMSFWQMAQDGVKELHYAEIASDHHLRIGNFRVARGCLQRALDLNALYGQPDAQVHLLKQLGDAHEGLSEYEQAVMYYEQSCELARERDDQVGIASGLVGLGEVAQKRGDYEIAQDCHTQAQQLARTIGHDALLAAALNGLGTIAAQRGQLQQASTYFSESLALRRTLHDQKGIGASLNNLGIVHRFTGDLEAAIRYLQEGLAIRRQISDRRGIASSLSNLGITARNRDDYTAARNYYEESVAIFREIGDQRGVASALNNLGSVNLSLQDYTAAQNAYTDALAIARHIGDQRAVGYALHNLGRVALAEGQNENAIQQFGQSLAITQQQGDKRGSADTLNDLAMACYQSQDQTQAVRHAQHALTLYREVGDQTGIVTALHNLSRYTPEPAQRANYLLQALQNIQRLNHDPLLLMLLTDTTEYALSKRHYALAAHLMRFLMHQRAEQHAELAQQLNTLQQRLDILNTGWRSMVAEAKPITSTQIIEQAINLLSDSARL